MSQQVPSQGASPRKIGIATGIALLVAVAVLAVAVLPAEYGLDPLGTGQVLGLTALAESGTGAIVRQPAEYKLDATEFVLGAYEFIEYKYRIEEGASLLYSWEATGPVIYDFHSEPDGGPEGYAESFDKDTTATSHGEYTAPFSGIHGWFWENPGARELTIRLTTAGFYSAAQEFRGDGSSFHELRDLRGGEDEAAAE